MSTPNITIDVEPVESGKLHYLPLGATKAGGSTSLKIIARLALRNNSSTTTKVKAITFSFPGSSLSTVVMQNVNTDASLDILSGQTKLWSNGVVPGGNNAVYLPTPAPPRMTINITVEGFANPATKTLELEPHKSPVKGNAYRFPYAAADLRKSEYLTTSAVHWANGGSAGTQIYAHDVRCVGWADGSWSELVPGGDKTKNQGYRIWGKPVRAMADGTVEQFFNTMEDNTVIGSFPTPTPSPGAGNHIFINHGSERVGYFHFQKGSIPAALQAKGAVVSEGQVLGLAGNSGNSTLPHTHIEVERGSDNALRPLPFRNAWVIDQASLSSAPSSAGPWYKLNQEGIPKEIVNIWPANTFPGFPVAGAGFSISGNWANNYILSPDFATFQSTVQNLFDNQGRRLLCANTYVENGTRRWSGVARSGDWAHRWWVSGDLTTFLKIAQDFFDKDGLRLTYVNTFVERTQRQWIGIARSGNWENRLIIENDLASFEAKAQDWFDNHGLRLTHVTTWLEGSQRRWLGIARTGDWANRWWISSSQAEFVTKVQQLFDNEQKRLCYFTTFKEGTQRKWIGIARSGTWAHRFYIRGDLDSLGLEVQQLFDHDGLRCEQIEYLE